MIRVPHWQLKSHFHYIRSDGDKQAYEARIPVLLHLILSANANLRCFVGIQALCRDTGFTNKPITEALQWLQDHGAIYNVPKEQRVGAEKRLHANKKVWQLTGILKVAEGIIDYLYTGDENSDTKNQFETLVAQLKENAPDEIINLFNEKIGVQNPSKNNVVRQNATEIDVQNTYSSDLMDHKTDIIHVQNPTISSDEKIDVQNPHENDDIDVQSPTEIRVQDTHEDINKVQDINKQRDINNISLSESEDDFLSDLNDLFAEDDEPAITDVSPSEGDSEPETTDTIDPAWDKPYTPAEYEHFKDRVSLTALESDVYNPCHNTSHARTDFRQPTKTYTDWQQLVAVIEEFFPTHSTGYATKIAQQLAATAKSGQRKEFEISPPMDAVEACGFAYWLREGEQLERLPERSERIQERAMQFRALSNHFEHVNFARYTLAELMASHENPDQPALDPNLFKPASDEVLEKVYADAEALLGFSLSGDF